MPIDLNEEIYEGGGEYECIPAGTVATLIINVEPEDNTGHPYRQSKNTDAVYMKCIITVTSGPYTKRWFIYNMTLNGGKRNDRGMSIAGIISGKTIRQIVESSRGISSKATDEDSIRGRFIEEYSSIHGMEFCGRIGIEDARPPYPARNKLSAALPADHREYISLSGAGKVNVPNVQSGPKAPVLSNDGPSVAPSPAPAIPNPAPSTGVPAPSASAPDVQPSWMQD